MKKVLILLVALILGFIGFVAAQPSEFSVSRTVQLAAPPEVVFAAVSDFHRWEQWSPWVKLDPGIKTAYKGTASGVGAVYEWAGNDQVGEGRMTITDAKPNQSVTIKLEFIKPWEVTNTATFTFSPVGENTKTVWMINGPKSFMAKAAGLFVDMNAMIGADFDKGLASLKTVAEADFKKRTEEAAKRAADEAAAKSVAAGTENIVQ